MMPADISVLSANWLPAVVVNGVLAVIAYRLGGVRRSGVYGGLGVGIPIYLFLGWRGFLVLAAMYAVSTALTRVQYERKERLGTAEAQRGARGASHALANVGVAVLCAAAAWGTGHPGWRLAFTGALATAAMDTAGSEVGPVLGGATISLKTLRRVPPGTAGAISAGGTVGGLLVAVGVGALAVGVGVIEAPMIVAVGVGALVGNLYEGILGARGWLSHGWLNATNTGVGAVGAVIAGWLLRG